MDKAKQIPEKIITTLKKYKYVALVLLLGMALMLIPFGSGEDEGATVTAQEEEVTNSDIEYVREMEQRLTQMLLQVDGAGRVSVMLTLHTGARTQYQTDTQTSAETTSGSTQTSEDRKTVILSKGSAYDEAAVSATLYPQFQGALIVSEGADNAEVKLNLVSAVAALTGLGTDKITVVKMK